MGRVQDRRRGRGHPGCVRTCLRVHDLLRQHIRHVVGDGPHALADLCSAAQPAGQSDVHVVVLVGLDPRRLLHVGLAYHGPCLHGCVDLVTGPIQEASVDEDHPLLGGADALLQVASRASLFVHDPHLQRVPRQAQGMLHTREELVGEGHLLRPVHLGLDDVDGALAGVAAVLQIELGDGTGEDRVHDALWNLLALLVQDGPNRHEMPHVAHEEQ
mmetsp:Transcript_117692/g.327726  ORF Transcript_117692/g.327726 Transcript_117692/m.327726 type:complete len:215 (-) Transcript_117692:1096-1740(-)